jgi:hypothetical protein
MKKVRPLEVNGRTDCVLGIGLVGFGYTMPLASMARSDWTGHTLGDRYGIDATNR